MAKPLELRKVVRILKRYNIIYVTGKGRHPKFYDSESRKSYPVKSTVRRHSFCRTLLKILSKNLICQQMFLKSDRNPDGWPKMRSVMAIEIRRIQRIKLPDAIIAATAKVRNLCLVTRNINDFRKVDIQIANPFE